MTTTDKIIRPALKKVLGRQHFHEPHTRIVDEFELLRGGSKIDIAVINGVLHGYELKSDADNLERLPWQMEAYNSVFDRLTIVVGREHLVSVVGLIPNWWGIILAKYNSAKRKIELHELRGAAENPQRENYAIASLLWKNEALDILDEINMSGGMSSKNRTSICHFLANAVDQEFLRDQVREKLLNRVNWRSDG